MTGRSGYSWLEGHRWCPNDTTGYGIDGDDYDDDDDVDYACVQSVSISFLRYGLQVCTQYSK